MVRIGIPLVALGVFAVLEQVFPRRQRTEPLGKRAQKNIIFASFGIVTMLGLNRLLILPAARFTVEHRFGILQRRRLPQALETALGLALLDYTLYLWHDLSHRVEFLWRMHVVHHADPDMDVTTGIRFHLVELAMSIPLRALIVGAFGVSPRAMDTWQTAIVVSSVFHHANMQLPRTIERWLSFFIVTPRLHEIHHAQVGTDRNSNFSSGLALWDLLHRTHKIHPSTPVRIGLPESIQGDESTVRAMLMRPFVAGASTE